MKCAQQHAEYLVYNAVVLQSIFEILRAEVEHASQEYTESKQRFWQISTEIPTVHSQPEGKQGIENAARAQTAAMNAYTKALKRFNEFLLSGTIPEDLRQSGQGNSSAAGSAQGAVAPPAEGER